MSYNSHFDTYAEEKAHCKSGNISTKLLQFSDWSNVTLATQQEVQQSKVAPVQNKT